MAEENSDVLEIDPPAAGLLVKDGEVAPPSGDATPEPTGWAAERIEIAAGDEKILRKLERYESRSEMIKAGIEAQNKLGSVKAKAEPGPDSTEGEWIDYRKAHGVPETSDKYNIKLESGTVLADEDAYVVEHFKKVAHELNLPEAKFNKMVNEQLKLKDLAIEQRAQADVDAEHHALAELSKDTVWGSETKRNLTMINAFLDTAPPGVKEAVHGARLADGTPMASSPGILRFLNSISRKLNPMGTVTPQAGQSQLDTITNEIAAIEKLMGDRKSEYWKGAKAEGMQKRFRELTEMQEANEKLR